MNDEQLTEHWGGGGNPFADLAIALALEALDDGW